MSSFTVSRPIPRFLVRQPTGGEHEVEVVADLRHAMVQSFDLFVAHATGSIPHTVVIATDPVLSGHDRDVVVQAFAATRRPQVAFLDADSMQGASAQCPTGGKARAVAAAVAVVRSFTGRDAAARQIVSINGQSLAVAVASEGLKWQCQVEESGR